jgi:hypothetical protein
MLTSTAGWQRLLTIGQVWVPLLHSRVNYAQLGLQQGAHQKPG